MILNLGHIYYHYIYMSEFENQRKVKSGSLSGRLVKLVIDINSATIIRL